MWSSVNSRTRLVGRERELSMIRRLLRGHRLVTLVGPGGSGKTRLAAELSPDEPGTAVAELESVHRPELLWHVVAWSVGVWEEPGEPLAETLVRALSERRLLVLDNCEHVINETARLVTLLLSRCPRLRVLVTSREPLDLAGEMCVDVGPLSPADARQLFVECAGLAEYDAALVDELCERLDRIPLPIELAAQRVGQYPLAEIVRMLGGPCEVWDDDERRPPRHRSLDAVIRWSYRLLSPAEQIALRRLSVLVGDFDLDMATAVCEDPSVPAGDMVQLMASLRLKSLVVRSQTSNRGARFRLLEAIRLFGRARLAECGETEETFDRLVTVLVRTIRMVVSSVGASPQANAWIVEREHLLLHAVSRLDDTDSRRGHLVAALVHAWFLRGSFVEARRLAAETIATGPLESHPELLLFRASWLAGMSGDGDEALRLALALRAHPTVARLPSWQARSWNTLGYARSVVGDLAGADDAYARSVTVAREAGDGPMLMTFLNNYAWLLLRRGSLDQASALVDEAMRTGTHDEQRAMSLLQTAGAIELARGDLDLAEAHFTQALRVGTSSCVALAGVLEGLGMVAARRNEVERTVVLMAAATATRRSRGTMLEPPWTRMVADTRDSAMAQVGERRAERARQLGERLDHAGLLEYVMADERADEPLTARQQQIADLVVEGLTNPEIASRLGISTGTVRSHVAQMLARLGLSSRTQLAARAARR